MTETNNPEAGDLPEPTGWRILLKMPEVEEKSKGGIFYAPQTKDNEKILTFMGQVVDMGALCYTRPEHMVNGRYAPWCLIGDDVLISKYAGTRVVVRGQEYRIVNDDEVQARVPDPSIVKRA